MTGKLDGRIAVVTGAGSGIGRETAILFGREGATVLVADRDTDAAGAVAAELTDRGATAQAHTVDVSREDEVAAMIDHAVSRFGKLDVLINNAGYGITGTVVSTSAADWNALMNVNVNGVFYGCKHAIPVMERAGGGAIVNTASTTSRVGITDRAAYVASKGAVAALTRAMALDHADANIRINCVGPGTIESPYFDKIFAAAPDAAALRRTLEMRHPMNRMGKPGEIAKAILFLASDDASFCTGTTLFADGGWTAR